MKARAGAGAEAGAGAGTKAWAEAEAEAEAEVEALAEAVAEAGAEIDAEAVTSAQSGSVGSSGEGSSSDDGDDGGAAPPSLPARPWAFTGWDSHGGEAPYRRLLHTDGVVRPRSMRAWWGTGLGLNTGDSGGGGGGRSARKLNLSDRFSAAHFVESEQERRAHDRQVGLTSGSSRSSVAVAVASRSTRSRSSRSPVQRRDGTHDVGNPTRTIRRHARSWQKVGSSGG